MTEPEHVWADPVFALPRRRPVWLRKALGAVALVLFGALVVRPVVVALTETHSVAVAREVSPAVATVPPRETMNPVSPRPVAAKRSEPVRGQATASPPAPRVFARDLLDERT